VTGNLEPEFIDALERIAVNGVVPHLTLVLDLAAATGLERARGRLAAEAKADSAPDRFEREELDTHEKRRQAFLDIAAADPKRCRVIDADRTVGEIADSIAAAIEPLLADLKPVGQPETVGAE
ncbi:MAG: thymidylate kinase, partial [Rhizobium sp.]|nr:thymidylate kinase [Rhizobium sp.]